MRTPSSIGIVGGGIVGLAVGRELTRRRPGTRVVVLEREGSLATGQTGHNSGVVHAGIYYTPGSLKAILCSRGRELLRDYCVEHDLPYLECGKLVVALDADEDDRLAAIQERAARNGVPGLRRLDPAGIREIEPHTVGVAALHSPHTAITDYVAVAGAMAGDILDAGGEVLLRSEVTSVREVAGGVDVLAGGRRHRFDHLVVCAGLFADRVAPRGGRGPSIVPFRGEYLDVVPAKRDLVRGLVYPVPDPRYPFLGVHFTRRVGGGLDIGPNAVLALAREGYRWRDVSARDLSDILRYPGFWRLARKHWPTGVREVLGSVSVRAYLRTARRYVPEIGPDDVTRGGSGVRAQAVDRDGTLVDDFRIESSDAVTAVRNAPSPAATSSLAIAEYLVDRLVRAAGPAR